MSNELKKSLESAAKVVGEHYGGAIGGAAVDVGIAVFNNFSNKIIDYFVPDRITLEDSTDDDAHTPPIMLIGLGRCGTHISTMLGSIVADALAQEESRIPTRQTDILTSLTKFLGISGTGKNKFLNSMVVTPRIFLGDIDENTILECKSDVETLIRQGAAFETIDFRPLAKGGVGNVPIFAEFFTRGLLIAPPSKDTNFSKTRKNLLDNYIKIGKDISLVFYAFSTSGGTGCGAAQELLKSQRFHIYRSNTSAQMYNCGVAVMPTNILLRSNQTYARNTGRMFVQYLSDLNIRLDSFEAYHEAPRFDFASEFRQVESKAEVTAGEVKCRSWDGLAIVSNDLGFPDEGNRETAIKLDLAESEKIVNRYIAQQLFNIGSAQLPINSRAIACNL